MNKKINKRLEGRSTHIGGSAFSDNVDPNIITEEAVKAKRQAREDAEDLQAFRTF